MHTHVNMASCMIIHSTAVNKRGQCGMVREGDHCNSANNGNCEV
jgi:hypothetical protein